jgi:hypothetical protein
VSPSGRMRIISFFFLNHTNAGISTLGLLSLEDGRL